MVRAILVLAAVLRLASPASAQSAWTAEISVAAGLGHVFRWEDQAFGDRFNAGGGIAIAHRSGWAFEWHADRTFGLEPREAPCGLVHIRCVGAAREGPSKMDVMSLSIRRYFGNGRLQPFLTGGLGVMRSRSFHSVTQIQGPMAMMSEFESRDTGFGPDLGAGLRFRIAPSWSLETEVRWLDAPWLSRQNLAVTRLLTGVTYALR